MKNFRAAKRNSVAIDANNRKTVYPTFPESQPVVEKVETVVGPVETKEVLKLVPAKTYAFDKTKFKAIIGVLVVAASAYFGSDYVQEILSFIPGFTESKVLNERLTKLEGEFATLTQNADPILIQIEKKLQLKARLEKLEASITESAKREAELTKRVVKLESNNVSLIDPKDKEKINEYLENIDSNLKAGVIKTSP